MEGTSEPRACDRGRVARAETRLQAVTHADGKMVGLILEEAAAAAAKSLQPCPTLCDPIDGSPPGYPRPWDSPGKNTAVGCHFLLQCVKVRSESEVARSCPTLSDPKDRSLPGSSVHEIFRKSTGVG